MERERVRGERERERGVKERERRRRRKEREYIPWKSPHLPCMIITSRHHHLFTWMQCYTVNAIVMSFDGGRRLQSSSACEVGTQWMLHNTVVWITRLTRIIV